MELTTSDSTSFVCAAEESSADIFDYITGTFPAASSPDPSFFTSNPLFSVDDIVLSDDDCSATSLASLEAPPLDTEATSCPLSDIWSITFSSNDQITESPLTTWADGFMEYRAAPPVGGNSCAGDGGDATPWITQTLGDTAALWMPDVFSAHTFRQDRGAGVAEACVPPSSLFRAESRPSVDLELSSEKETLFFEPICQGVSVFQPIPDVLPISGSSDLNTDDLLSFLNELETQHFGAVSANGNGNASPGCPSPSSDSESSASSQSPIFSTHASPSPIRSPSPILTSSQPAEQSPEPRVVVLDVENPGPSPPRQAPKIYNYVFDLKTFGEVYGCKCSKKTKKKNRHWKSCPSNPNRPKIPCPYCPTSKNKTFKGGSAMANLQKHVRVFHPGSIVPGACRPSKRRE